MPPRFPFRPSKSALGPRPRAQAGQALIYGIFVLLGGLVALFFMFNTGQLSAEKTKLVNTADAVAYSAGVMHARALNFDAYTNRALIANEALIAQMVSASSWVQYAEGHAQRVPALNCYQVVYSVPFPLELAEYLPLCFAISWPPAQLAIQYAKQGINAVAPAAVVASEVAKQALQLSQTTMYASFLPARKQLMQQVADANYLGDGVIKVDTIPLTDHYTVFEGKPFITPNTGNQRTRFREAELKAASLDRFVGNRAWESKSGWGCIPVVPRGIADHTGSTTLVGFDEWRAADRAGLKVEVYKIRLFSSGCKTISNYGLGDGKRSAKKNAGAWTYSGVPSFYDLSSEALKYGKNGAAAGKTESPSLRFAIRLVREKGQAMTSAGRSQVKPQGAMALFEGKEAGDVLAAVATSEVYFERFRARADGRVELASLFNPYWQVHIIGNSSADIAAAMALQAGTP